MKKFIETFKKSSIKMILGEIFSILWKMFVTVCKIIVHFPMYVVYANALIFVVGKIENQSNDNIFKLLNKLNTLSGFYLILIIVIITLGTKWFIQQACDNDYGNSEFIGKGVACAVVKKDIEEMELKQKAKFTLYENGIVKESRILEYNPNEKFTISNMELDKIYMLVKEEIANE